MRSSVVFNICFWRCIGNHIVLDLAFGKARTKFINNENKHYMRGVRSIEPFDYDDELLTAHHLELVVDNFEETFLRNETCQKVRSALATLQEVQKERVIKYFFDGKSTHEIALEEGVSHQAVSQSIAVALKKLKNILK